MSTKHEVAAQLRGSARSAGVARKINEAMDVIRAEMKANAGIYPHNGGAVSKNEVARRAGVSLTTLFSPKQKELGQQVSRWLEAIKDKHPVGRTRVRRTYAERAEDWKARYLALESSHIKTELDLLHAEAERDEAAAEVKRLRDDNLALLEQLRLAGASKVKPFPKGKS